MNNNVIELSTNLASFYFKIRFQKIIIITKAQSLFYNYIITVEQGLYEYFNGFIN